MKELLEEVGRVIERRIIAGEFEVVEVKGCTIILDLGDATVELWIANIPQYNFKLYGSNEVSLLAPYCFMTTKTRQAGYNMVKKFIVLQDNKDKIEALKKELKLLEERSK